ncbi:hypothetical protein VCHENC02_2783A, partial [Vibrio harveyi]
MNKNDVIFS